MPERAALRRSVLWTAVGAPVALVVVVGVEIWLAATAEYLPTDPGYEVTVTRTPPGSAAAAPLRLVVLGDSTVAGVGSPTVEQSLAVLVANRVAAELGRPVEVRGLGASGARTADLPSEQLPRVVGGRADAVVIVIGSNDVTHLTPPWAMQAQTVALLAAARDAADGAPVILAGIPLFGSADALAQPLRALVDGYAAVLRERQRTAAAEGGAVFVDIAADASPRFAGVPAAMSPDGFHPSPIGYGFWADAIAPALTAALG